MQIDKRAPRNQLAQAAGRARGGQSRDAAIAEAQSKRSKTLLESRTINEVDYEQTILEFANAKADVIRAEVAVENARIALDDTDVRAPIDRHDHRETRRERPGDLFADDGRRRRYAFAQDGRPRVGRA